MPTVRRTLADIRNAVDEFDWSSVEVPPSDEEIARQIAEDPDAAPDLSERDWSKGQRIARPPDDVDVRAVREKLGLSRSQFAARYGFNRRTLEQWETGRRRPEGAARMFLRVIEREPAAVERALQD